MIAIFLAALGALFEEISNSLEKFAMTHKLEHPAVIGLLNSSWTVVYFLAIAFLYKGSFVLVKETIPWLCILVVLCIAQTVLTLLAIQQATRSTFGLLRTLTIPILALLDALTGAAVSPLKFVAMGIMFVTMAWMEWSHTIERKGAGLVIATALNGAVTLALFKYILTAGTSVTAAQIVILLPGVLFLAIWSRRGKRPSLKGKVKLMAVQTAAYGAATLVESYALLLAPASIMTAALRSSAVLWSVISGNKIFHEQDFKKKIIGSGVILLALALLVVG
ncbi:MAG: hypothetical protein ABIO72_04620 [Patescibacteria group bacterium]